MSGDSEHPVTLGDLYVDIENGIQFSNAVHPATVADLVSALRAEGYGQGVWWCLNDESVGSSDRCDTAHKSYVPCRMVKAWLTIEEPPPKDPWDYDP